VSNFYQLFLDQMREAVETLSQTEDFLLPWIVAESELKALAENHDALKDGEEEVLSGGMIVISLIFCRLKDGEEEVLSGGMIVISLIFCHLKDGEKEVLSGGMFCRLPLYLVFILKRIMML